ncbi:MFS transporter [Nocardiopsis potens]|uniref:MFS transporter n=1 Tax=Nocardiopsis potens TaxID=1246458 RepID=UPI00034DE443|nr:MFS transporter [Nocardiopsis potens]
MERPDAGRPGAEGRGGRRTGLGGYLAGAGAARIGEEMAKPALVLAGLAVTGSAAAASALPAGLAVAAVVGGPLVGAVLDRGRRPGRALAGMLAGYAAGIGAVALLLGRAPLAAAAAVAVGAGLLGPAVAGGWSSRLGRAVGAARLARASALDAMTFGVAGLVGPALVGLAAEAAGTGAAVALAVLLLAAAVPFAWSLPDGKGPPPCGTGQGCRPAGHGGRDGGDARPGGPPGGSGGGSGARQGGAAGRSGGGGGARQGRSSAGTGGGVRRGAVPGGGGVERPAPVGPLAGAVALFRGREPARATAATTLSAAQDGMLVVCWPLLGAALLGGAERGALMMALSAAASLAANMVLARRPPPVRPGTVLWASSALLACAVLLAASATGGWPLAGAALLIGIAQGPQLTALFRVRHRASDERVRGSVFTTGASLKITAFAAGAALAGPLAARSLTGALLAAAFLELLALAVFALITLVVPDRAAGAGRGPGRPRPPLSRG